MQAAADVVVALDAAIISPYAQGVAATLHPPDRWMRGAVHTSSGELVPHSQRTWSRDNANAPVAIDPAVVRVGRRAESLPGQWTYAGHWSRHFGHFLLEVVPTLWPERPPGLAGLVAHRSFRQPHLPAPHSSSRPAELLAWQEGLLALAGYGDLPVHVVRGRTVQVERLVVPSRPVVFRTEAGPAAVLLWQRMARAAGPPALPGAKVFLSRRRFHAGRTRTRSTHRWDERLERVFRAAGYVVVHPEQMSVAEQVRTVSGASVLAGASGSALHQAVFCRPGTHVIEVGDARTSTAPQSSQVMVDRACGHRSMFVPYQDGDALDAAVGK